MSPETDELMVRLESADPRQRELAADILGDRLEQGALLKPDHDLVAAAIVRSALNETDNDARESQLNALGYSFDLTLPIVEPLIALMPKLDKWQLGYCLDILAATHNPMADATIVAYTDHPDEDVRANAKEALIELHGRR